MTCFPPREERQGDNSFQQGDLKKTIYDDVNGDPYFAKRCENCFDLAALVVYHAVTVFLERIKDKDLQVFRVFEEYISVLTEQQTVSFKEFRDRHRRQQDEMRHKRDIMFDHSKDLTAYLELRDVEDELTTLKKLFSEQKTVVGLMSDKLERRATEAAQGWLRRSLQLLDGYESQVNDMIENCKAAQESYKALLDMKQKQANVDEAYLARQSQLTAADQSRAIMVFTVFTIIFLPLSFFTSLFGMNAREWSGASTDPTLHTIGVLMGSISISVIAITLLLAFNKSMRRMLASAYRSIAYEDLEGPGVRGSSFDEPFAAEKMNVGDYQPSYPRWHNRAFQYMTRGLSKSNID
ncbi:hypothetical protein H2203_001627 [Taxawa tesnikishii (nom. ined.)]|nr:hypothetical protein H2203_001627 [Dothideales sp. JES 119]